MDRAVEAAGLLHLLRDSSDPAAFHHWMRHDPSWAVKVRFVCRVGIPMTEFLGRVPQPGKPRWTAFDRQVAMEYERWSGQVCPNCGLHPLDWENERDETYKGVVEACFGCRELSDTRAQLPSDLSEERRSELRVYLTPRSERERVLLDAVDRDELPADVLDDLT